MLGGFVGEFQEESNRDNRDICWVRSFGVGMKYGFTVQITSLVLETNSYTAYDKSKNGLNSDTLYNAKMCIENNRHVV